MAEVSRAKVLALLNFLVLLVACLALVLRVLLDVRRASLARDALERLLPVLCLGGHFVGRLLQLVILGESRHSRRRERFARV